MSVGSQDASLLIEPIGHVRTGATSRVEAPHQPSAARGRPGLIELREGRNLEHAVEDLAGCDRIWVIFWFHLNHTWRPKVLPPRGVRRRRGVLATRSPYRPNPIGLSVLRLASIDGLMLSVLDLDMIDGTPVLDIKPYVAYTDAHPDAEIDWLRQPGANGRDLDPIDRYQVCFSELANDQLRWIDAHGSEPIREKLEILLAAEPNPRPYRRIKREGAGFRVAMHDWRAFFSVDGQVVLISHVATGYRASQLASGQGIPDDQLILHREFQSRWRRD